LHYRVTLGDAIAAHARALEESGGRDGILDVGRIEAAVARPYSGYYRAIHKKAAVLVHGLATNHGFVDGNKRTALMLGYTLLRKSEYELHQTSTLPDEDDLEHLIVDLTTRFLNLDEGIAWFRHRIRRI